MAEKNYGSRFSSIKKIVSCTSSVKYKVCRRISVDNPDWLKATNHYYHRGEFVPVRKENKIDQKQYDVMGHKKTLNYGSRTEGLYR